MRCRWAIRTSGIFTINGNAKVRVSDHFSELIPPRSSAAARWGERDTVYRARYRADSGYGSSPQGACNGHVHGHGTTPCLSICERRITDLQADGG
jgi:hypothetical protein